MKKRVILELPDGLIARLAKSMQNESDFLKEEAFVCEAYDTAINHIWDADEVTPDCLLPLKAISRYKQVVKELSSATLKNRCTKSNEDE